MPYESTSTTLPSAPDTSGADGLPASHHIMAWPFKSLPRTGFVWFIALTAGLLSLPLFAVIGSPVFWGTLPFLGLSIAAIWWALRRNSRDGDIVEDLIIWPDRVSLVRQGPLKKRAEWEANPYWITPVLHKTGGPVPNYLTLRGGPREVELGAFLSEQERIALFDEVTHILQQMRQAQRGGAPSNSC